MLFGLPPDLPLVDVKLQRVEGIREKLYGQR
jgi:hypothetical protein